MKFQRLVVAVVFFVLTLVLFRVFDERSKIKYPPGITIVKVISKFKSEPKEEYFGSGFFIDNKYIATSNHVVELIKNSMRQKAEVTIFDGKDTHPAKIVGFDSDTDVALLEPLSWCGIKIQTPCFRTVSEKDIRQAVIVYPSPPSWSLLHSWFDSFLYRNLSLRSSDNRFGAKVLKGYIAGFEDWIGIKVIRHLSGIMPGYSGTPLLDTNNCYVGMNFKYDRFRLSVSYAISNDNLQPTFREIKERGYVETSFLGLAVGQGDDGVYILAVAKNGPAEVLDKYGIQVLELKNLTSPELVVRYRIYKINGTEIRNIKELWTAIRGLKPGNSVQVVLKDMDNKVYAENIKLVSRFHFIQKYSLIDLDFVQDSYLVAVI